MMPCLLPVMTIDDLEVDFGEVIKGSSVVRPLITPKRLTVIIFWKYSGSVHDPFVPMAALRCRREILPVVYIFSLSCF